MHAFMTLGMGTLLFLIVISNSVKSIYGGSEIILHDDIIKKEYMRCLTTNKILNNLYKLCRNDKDKYEIKNILERYLIFSANHIRENVRKPKDAVYSIGINTDKFRDEIARKIRYININEASSILDKNIKEYISNIKFFKHKNFEKIVIKYGDKIEIKYGIVSKSLEKNRYNKLITKGIDNLIKCILRYESIISTSQQWSIPSLVYKNLDKFCTDQNNNIIEGFTSPFNSQLLLIKDNAKFCSLFKDTDKVYGSIGDFFSSNFQGYSVIVNPPFIESIINETTKKCISECEKAKNNNNNTRFFIIFAAWKDIDAYDKLINTKFLKKYIELEKNKHYYIDTNMLNKKIYAKFNTACFVISQGFTGNYNNIWNSFYT